MEKIVITGLGSLTSHGSNAKLLWKHLSEGNTGIGSITRFDASKYRTQIGGEVQVDVSTIVGFNVSAHARHTQFALAAAQEALSDSGVLAGCAESRNIGICLGSGLGGLYFSEEALNALNECGPRGVSPMAVPFVDPNGIVSQIAIKWRLLGRQFTVSTACSSSAHALGLGMDMIRGGHCDAALVGGVEASMSPLIFAGFDRLRAMTARNEQPATACRPFSSDRDGFVMAEGAAMLMLERESYARERGARIYAELAGYGASGGGHHAVAPRPDGSDLVAAMQQAITHAGINAQQIDLINPHGTGTLLNDAAELSALQAVFGDRLPSIALTPTKQLTGHLLGAAGALESIHIVKSLFNAWVTPIQYYEGDANLNIAVGRGYEKNIRYALNCSFGFGNNNVGLIFGACQ